MNTLREYVTALGLPAASNPASRTFAADEHRSARSSPRACSRVVASSTFRVAPSRARRSTRRITDGASMYVAFEHSSVNTCPVYGFTFRTRNQEDDPLRWHLDRERAYRQRAQEPRRPAYRAEGPSR